MKYFLFCTALIMLVSCDMDRRVRRPINDHNADRYGFVTATLVDTAKGVHTYITEAGGRRLRFYSNGETCLIGKCYQVDPKRVIKSSNQ